MNGELECIWNKSVMKLDRNQIHAPAALSPAINLMHLLS
jgi:hypothetical protein